MWPTINEILLIPQVVCEINYNAEGSNMYKGIPVFYVT